MSYLSQYNLSQVINITSTSIISMVISLIFIYQGYKYFKVKWPEDYFGPNDKDNIFLSTKPMHYILFRLFPVLCTIALIQGTIFKAGYKTINPILLGASTAFIYSISTDGKAFIDLLKGNENIQIYVNKTFQSILHVVLIIILTITGCLAGFLITLNQVQFLLPELNNLRDNIWAGFITVIMFYIVRSIINKPKKISITQVIKKSSDIGLSFVNHIEKYSAQYKADPLLVKAVCIAENIERPKWFRNLEYVISFIKKKGTYGIMQVASDHPISDEESIKIAIEKYFKDSVNLTSLTDKLLLIKKYNGNENYIRLIEEIYRFFNPV